jgi:thiol-disulfide isomerase/thioredoxin
VMRSSRVLLWGSVVAASLAAGAAGRAASVQILDVDGRMLKPFDPSGAASLVFFVATDCPVSNSYAPEIQRICREYGPRGVACSLMYEDPPPLSELRRGLAGAKAKADLETAGTRLDEAVREHMRQYGYSGIAAAVDRSRVIAKRANASVTPQAVVIDHAGEIRYRGRIDNFYAAFGKPRQQVTEHDLRNAIDAVLSRRPVPRRETEAIGCYIVDPAVLRKQ